MKTKIIPTLLIFTFILGTLGYNHLTGQEVKSSPCDKLYVDLEKGTLNGHSGTLTMDEVKVSFPCFTGESEENVDGMNCGGGVFFLNHYFNFYTLSDYILIRPEFKGEVSNSILGMPTLDAKAIIGEPVDEFTYEDDWLGEKTIYMQYQQKWGVLVLRAKNGTVESIELHSGKNVGEIDFCL